MKRDEFLARFPNASESTIRKNCPDDPGKVAVMERDSLNMDGAWLRYCELKSIHKTASELGVCGETLRRLFIRNGRRLFRSIWTKQEDAFLLSLVAMETAKSIAAQMGRSEASVEIRKSKLMRDVATDNETAAALEKQCPHCKKDFYTTGKSKTVFCSLDCFRKSGECLKINRELGLARRKSYGETDCPTCGEHFKRTSRGPSQVFCSIQCAQSNPEVSKRRLISLRANPSASKTSYPNCQRGWVEIGGQRFFARSLWEANYAKFLEWQKARGEIVEWVHEPDTFWFEGIKRGTVSYLPDFRVKTWDGAVEYHETKGWMDSRSKTQIRRMAKYHPAVKLVVIDSARYKSLSITCRNIVPGWVVKPPRKKQSTRKS